MSKNRKSIALLTAVQFIVCASALAENDQASAPEGEAMVKQAVALIKSAGPEKAYKVFTEHPGGAFKDRDLYVFVYDFDGTCLAQGANPKMVGKNLLIIKDVDGNPFIKGMIDMVKSKGKGWYGPYKFNNIKTSTYDPKKSYCEQGAPNTIVCVGIHP
ncbi:cache domain-containing protein [Duganella caerulea]|uniref:cache domain-containing protein n=1 Tax=Duganella caerulea TaxID=2885762 RepID=UPI004038013C